MNSFTTSQTFEMPYWAEAATLIVQANGGQVAVEVLLDEQYDTWITYATYAADGVHKVDANGVTFRVTPSGGAVAAVVHPDE